MNELYLDYNATTPINRDVLKTMIDVYENNPGNADSRTHNFGENARKITENARNQLSELIGCRPDEVIFTSGATESNNIALQGLREYAEKTGKRHIITTAIEHKAVLNTAKYLQMQGFDVDFIRPDRSGRVKAEDIISSMRPNTLLVSIMHVNNETGIIQPVNEIGNYLADKDIFFHVDITQSCGKMVEAIRALKYDMLSLSAHKFGGPQGVGALILKKKNFKFPPVKGIYFGGQQEHGIRPGTTPVALVAGMGKAAEICNNGYVKNNKHNLNIRLCALKELEKSGIKYHFNGDQRYCINSSINICIEGVSSEALMLSAKQFCGISNGSACTSQSYAPSYVLMAIGIPEEEVNCSIRISWGPDTDINVFEENFCNLLEVAKRFQ